MRMSPWRIRQSLLFHTFDSFLCIAVVEVIFGVVIIDEPVLGTIVLPILVNGYIFVISGAHPLPVKHIP